MTMMLGPSKAVLSGELDAAERAAERRRRRRRRAAAEPDAEAVVAAAGPGRGCRGAPSAPGGDGADDLSRPAVRSAVRRLHGEPERGRPSILTPLACRR